MKRNGYAKYACYTPFATAFNFVKTASVPASIESLSPMKKSRPVFDTVPKTEFAADFYAAGNDDGPNHEFVKMKKQKPDPSSSSSSKK